MLRPNVSVAQERQVLEHIPDDVPGRASLLLLGNTTLTDMLEQQR